MKKLFYIFAILLTLLSCNSAKQAITFNEDFGFHCDDIYNFDHSEITRGFQLGEQVIYIEKSKAYATKNSVRWRGKTVDKYGEEIPYVSFYAVDSIIMDNELFSGHFLGTADKHGNFKIKDRTKSCKGFYIDSPGYLGTVYIMTSEHSH